MVIIDNSRAKRILITTARTAYCIGVDLEGNLQHIYWGKKLPFAADYPGCHETGKTVGIGKSGENPAGLSLSSFYYPYEANNAVINEEYTGWGGLNFVEPCLKVIFPDKVRDLVLKYDRHRIKANEVVVTLKDDHYPFFVHLHYRVHEEVDIIVRWAEIENKGRMSVILENAQSAVWYAPDNQEYRLSYMTGRWANEMNFKQTMLTQGKKVMESRRGITSHHEHPWFALDPNGQSAEDTGKVWFGALGWSGNWKMTIEYTSNRQMRVTGGINDFDFNWELKSGCVFTTPEFIAGYTEEGFNGSSQLLHRFGLNHVYPKASRKKLWPVFYNTWETFWFDFDCKKLMALAGSAAELGCEEFHVDDGWFSTRRDEYSGLGDWTVNKKKFPDGLRPLVNRVRQLGMKFSLWIEPENVNVNSDIYRAHPDWVYSFSTRKPSIQRESLILNFGRKDVQDHIWKCMQSLIKEFGIKHFKWDLNRHISEPGWGDLPVANQKELWVRHVQGLYAVKDKIKKHYPDVTIEACSGGGGRVDFGVLRYSEIALTSDNHDPLARLLIQEGYTRIYPAKTMGTWITDNPSPLTNRSLPLKFMFHTAMMGVMGIQSNIVQWSKEETAFAKEMIALHKKIRPIIQHGDLYRLNSLREDNIMAVQYVDKTQNESVLLAFMRQNCAKDVPITNIVRWASPNFVYKVFLRGLQPERKYAVDGCEGVRSGESLMSAGLDVALAGDYDSKLIIITAA